MQLEDKYNMLSCGFKFLSLVLNEFPGLDCNPIFLFSFPTVKRTKVPRYTGTVRLNMIFYLIHANFIIYKQNWWKESQTPYSRTQDCEQNKLI